MMCLLLVSTSQAQDSTVVSRWAVTFRPLGAADPFLANYTFGLQFRATDRISAEINAGLIKSYYNYMTDNKNEKFATGFRLGAEIKYRVVRKFYLAIQGFYNDYKQESDEYVWRYARTYQQKMELRWLIKTVGGHLRAGFVIQPFRKIFFDLYGGVGVRYKDLHIPNLPDDALIIESNNRVFIFNESEQDYWYPSLSLGAAVGYRF